MQQGLVPAGNVAATATIIIDASYVAGDTRYYTLTATTVNTSIPGVALTLTTNTRNWATVAQATADPNNSYTAALAADIAYAAGTRGNVAATATIITDANYAAGDTHYYTSTTTTTG